LMPRSVDKSFSVSGSGVDARKPAHSVREKQR
jgi:hypothetical protein